MSYLSPSSSSLPAPCIIDEGIVINKIDMKRLLSDLRQVRYFYLQDDRILSQGEGYVLEVFCDPKQSTLVANHTLYLNVYSFDYLELSKLPEPQAQPEVPAEVQPQSQFDLVQENLRLRLVPLSNPLQDEEHRTLNVSTLEAMMTEVISASWDARMDVDDDHLY